MEKWSQIQGYEGLYEVSDQGRVRSLDMLVGARNGHLATRKGKILKPSIDRNGYPTVGLHKNKKARTVRVHKLAARAFVPNPDSLPMVRHCNNNTGDPRAANLVWGTHWDNIADLHGYQPTTGRHKLCSRGHELTGANLDSKGRQCLSCRRAGAAIRGRTHCGKPADWDSFALADIYYQAALDGHNFSRRTYSVEYLIEQYGEQAKQWRKEVTDGSD